ncbi:hypothetical protein BS78_08G018800 [Paspalum vaginatum]|nr:hypothetical protein BS78_08G018800 [Paspalum vaginatum]
MVESLPTPKGDRRNLKAKQQTQATSITSGERKPRPQHDEALKCPRCDTTDTKFCYYNNKSLMQPRYFCKACRRSWTQGGILRDVPVGGGSRKNKRNSAALSSSATATSSSNTASSATKIISSSTHQLMMLMPTPMTTMGFSSVQPTTFMTATGGRSFEEHQVSLSFASLSSLSYNDTSGGGSRGMTASFMDMLRGGFLDSNDRSNGNRMPMPFSLPSLDAMSMHATQLVGSLQEQGGRNTTTGGLQQWPSSQYRSINDGGFTAGSSSSAAVQQQQQQHVGDHSVRQQEHRAHSGSSDAYTKSLWQGGLTNNRGSFDRS